MKPGGKKAEGGGGGRKGAGGGGGGKAEKLLATIPGEFRCCVAVGKEVWAADRSGVVHARNAKTGEVIAEVEAPRQNCLVW